MSFLQFAIFGNAVCNGWNAFLNYRQLRHCRNTPYSSLPQELQQRVSPENFQKSQDYCVARSRFAVIRTLWETIFESGMLYANLWSHLWTFVAERLSLPVDSFGHCWAWGASCDIIELIADLPWSIYYTFALEQRFGFNRTSIFQFVKDRIILIGLKTLVLRPLMTAVVRWCLTTFGVRFPLYLCGVSGVILVAATWIVPNFIMPLFNKFTPIESGSLKSRIDVLAKRVNFPLKRLYEMDGSKRSAHSNAFFYGFGGNKRIVLFDTLIKQLDELQIEAVLGHELGHWYHNHTLLNFCHTLAMLYGCFYTARYSIFEPKLYSDFGFTGQSFVVGFELFSAAIWRPIQEVLNITMSVWSRRCEFQADAFAVSLGYSEPLREGLLVMQKENLSTLTPDPLYAWCQYSHPPLVERLAALEKKSA